MPTQNNDAFVVLKTWLDSWGLAGLTDWVWTQVQDAQPVPSILLNLREQPVYKQRFPAMETLRGQGDAINEEQYMENERFYIETLRQMGAPPEAYTREGVASFFVNGVSPRELADRADTLNFIRNAPLTTARMASLFRQHANLPLTEEGVFNLLMGADNSLAEEYSRVTGTRLDTETVRANLREAIMAEQAEFRGGGGSIEESRGLAVGLLSKDEEVL